LSEVGNSGKAAEFEVGVSGVQCPAAVEDHVGYAYDKADVLPLNGTQEEVAALKEALLERRAAAKAKKAKKKLAHSVEEASGVRGPESAANGSAIESCSAQHSGAAEVLPVGRPMSKRGSEVLTVDEKVRAKRLKEALQMAPENASKAVWTSIFNSSTVEAAETYACRGNYGGLR
jgi:Rtf2 RING-finger